MAELIAKERAAGEKLAAGMRFEELGRVTPEKVRSAVERIVEISRPLQVIAFGSRARGSHRPDSDLDLAVMVDQYYPQKDRPPVRHGDLDQWMSVDLLVFGRARHEFMKDSIISVHHDIAHEGVILYDASIGSIDLGAVERIAG